MRQQVRVSLRAPSAGLPSCHLQAGSCLSKALVGLSARSLAKRPRNLLACGLATCLPAGPQDQPVLVRLGDSIEFGNKPRELSYLLHFNSRPAIWPQLIIGVSRIQTVTLYC